MDINSDKSKKESLLSEEDKEKILEDFANKLIENQKDEDPDLRATLSDLTMEEWEYLTGARDTWPTKPVK